MRLHTSFLKELSNWVHCARNEHRKLSSYRFAMRWLSRCRLSGSSLKARIPFCACVLRTWLRLYQEMKAHKTVVICIGSCMYMLERVLVPCMWANEPLVSVNTLTFTDKRNPLRYTAKHTCAYDARQYTNNMLCKKICVHKTKRFEREIENVSSRIEFTRCCSGCYYELCRTLSNVMEPFTLTHSVWTLICLYIYLKKKLLSWTLQHDVTGR